MIIRLYPENNALPIGPAVNRVGSALPLRIIGAPSGATGVAVSVFNADGAACNLAATHRGGEWVTTVPASHFASWGKVPRGLQVAVSYKDETDTTQTVVFVGDVRIEKTAAGDPEGTGKRSVPVTDVDEVAAGSSMKDIRDKVNELARIVSGTATALVLMALPLSAATPLEDIPGTNEVYTAAETDAAIIRLAPAPGNYNAVSNAAMSAVQPTLLLAACTASSNYTDQAIAAMPSGGITTNDVCAIVTNEARIVSAWTIEGLQPGDTYEFSDDGPGALGWSWMLIVTDKDGNIYYGGTGYTTEGPDDATRVVFDDGSFIATRTIETKNALDLARLTDLPPLTNGLASASSVAAASAAVAQSASNYTDSAIGGYLPMTNGTGSVVWDAIDSLNVNSGTLTVGPGAIYASAGTISLEGTSDGFTYNGSPVATYQSIATAADAGTNYTDSAISATDTSYPRVIGITNINQTVQYVAINSDVPTTLSIMLPTSGDTKDWIVYVTAQTNVTINLPAATWWLADTSATNDIAPQTPTALYFSQAADGIYTLGRQEFTEVVLP